MNISPRYWELHKKIYLQMLDKIDIDIQKKIIADPGCEEARLFTSQVDKAIKTILDSEINEKSS